MFTVVHHGAGTSAYVKAVTFRVLESDSGTMVFIKDTMGDILEISEGIVSVCDGIGPPLYEVVCGAGKVH